jgi:predicted MPP superfamily phosphohydrolase
MLVFISIFTAILLAAHTYVGWRLIGPARLSTGWNLAAWGLVLLFVIIHPVSFIGRQYLPSQASDLVQWVSYVCMGLFALVFCLVGARDLVWLLLKGAGTLPADPARRDTLLNALNMGILGTAGALASIGFVEATRRARVVDVKVPIDGLPPGLEGFRIAQISDIHIGPTIKRDFLEGVVAAVNELEADVIAVTGDLVDGSVEHLGSHVAPLGKLKAKHGAFFVTGNHEYYSGAEQWMAFVTSLGLKVLHNEHVVVDRDGGQVVVAGVTDYNAGQIIPSHASDPKLAVAGAPAGAVRVLLAHQPRSASAAVDAGFHLQLSGHTHGGQFVPWNLFVPLQQPFTAGLHKMQSLWVYVSRGTGYWGPPLRLLAPSEITRVTLVRA